MKKIRDLVVGDSVYFFPRDADGYRGDDKTITDVNDFVIKMEDGTKFYRASGNSLFNLDHIDIKSKWV